VLIPGHSFIKPNGRIHREREREREREKQQQAKESIEEIGMIKVGNERETEGNEESKEG